MKKIFYILKKSFDLLRYYFKTINQKQIINDFLRESKSDSIVITHDLGGGTEQFVKNNFYNKKYLIVRNLRCLKQEFYVIEYYALNQKIIVRLSGLKIVLSCFLNIIINSVCEFRNLFRILQICEEIKKANVNRNLLYLIHDFNCICPTTHLIADNYYCFLKCSQKKCVFKNQHLTIEKWREKWLGFLSAVDEIRCFSNSSKEILQLAYPSLISLKITVIPHDMSFSKFTVAKIDMKRQKKLGIVGRCCWNVKGAKILPYIVDNISKNIPIVFIGTSKDELNISNENVKFLGKYEHSNLQKIIEKENVSAVLFPTIGPETFSYLISEIMQMDLRIVCFNIGAQAEKICKYGKGYICNDIEEMVSVINRLY